MKSAMLFILWAFVIVLSVQARSIKTIESDSEDEMSNEQNDRQLLSKQYSKLLPYLNDDNGSNNGLSSSSGEDVKQLPKRGFFLFPDRRSSPRNRPNHSYGRKAHWDTFFG